MYLGGFVKFLYVNMTPDIAAGFQQYFDPNWIYCNCVLEVEFKYFNSYRKLKCCHSSLPCML